MVAIGLSALFALPPAGFSVFAIVVLIAPGAWEAARLAGLGAVVARITYAVGVTVVAAAGHVYVEHLPVSGLLWFAAGLWLVLLCWLGAPGLGRGGTKAACTFKGLVLAATLFFAWLAISALVSGSPWHVFMLVMLIAAADTFAYFTGRHFGGPRLAPRISPGKTRSGAIGGLAGAAAIAALAAVILPDSPLTPAFAAGLGLVVGLISIGGDLFFSLLKRQAGVKDSSRLLPGHGGILDRFDSLAAALPFFTLAVLHAERL